MRYALESKFGIRLPAMLKKWWVNNRVDGPARKWISEKNFKANSTVKSSTVTDAMKDLLTAKNQKGIRIENSRVFIGTSDSEDQLNIKVLNPLWRFPFRLTRELGSGGFAKVYEGFHHGTKRAFKFIPLDKTKFNLKNTSWNYMYNTKTYGCHEYYNQENDFNNLQKCYSNNNTKIKKYRSELMRCLVTWSMRR